MANYVDYTDAQLATKLQTVDDSSSSLSDDDPVHGPVVPPWFNDLIQHGFDGLLSIVTKNLAIEQQLTADLRRTGRQSLPSTSSLAADLRPQRPLIDTNNALDGNQGTPLQCRPPREEQHNDEVEADEKDAADGGDKDGDSLHCSDGANVIKELIADETAITGGTVSGRQSATHPIISPPVDTGNEDVACAEQGGSSDASPPPPTADVTTGSTDQEPQQQQQQINTEQHPIASGVLCMAPSSRQQLPSEEPRPGFVKLTTSQFEKQINSSEASAFGGTASSPANYMESRNDASCAGRVAAGNELATANGHGSVLSDDQALLLGIVREYRGDYGRESISTSASASPVTAEDDRTVATQEAATDRTSPNTASEHRLTSFTEACTEDNGWRQIRSEQQDSTEQVAADYQQEEVVKRDAANLAEPVLAFGNGRASACERGDDRRDERQTTKSASAAASDHDAFPADGKWTADGQVEAQCSVQTWPPSTHETTCLGSSEGGDHELITAATSLQSFDCTHSQPDGSLDSAAVLNNSATADCSVLLSCAGGGCLCLAQTLLADLTALCDHHEDEPENDDHGDSDSENLKWPKRQEGEDREQVNRELQEEKKNRLQGICASVSASDSHQQQRRPDVPQVTAGPDGVPSDRAEHLDDQLWPQAVASGAGVEPPVISDSASAPCRLQSSSSPVVRTSAASKFNDHRDACHRPQLLNSPSSFSADQLLQLHPSPSSQSVSASPTPPPTPTVPCCVGSSTASHFEYHLTPATSNPPASPASPAPAFGQLKRLKHLPRLRSAIVEFERQGSIISSPLRGDPHSAAELITTSGIASTERFIVQIKALLCTDCLCAQTRFTSGDVSSGELYLIRLNLFRRTSKSCPVTVDTDPDVQFSLDQLFAQLSIVNQLNEQASGSAASTGASVAVNSHSCTGCQRELNFDATVQHRPLIYLRNEPLPPSASVLVSLCSRVSHNLAFTFGPVNEAKVKMVEEGVAASAATAPNRLILLRPHSVGCRYYQQHHQKRPSSVNSSSSGSDHTKESDPDCLGSDSAGSDGPLLQFDESDCEYGPGFVGRLCNKFMTMYGQPDQTAVSPVNGLANGSSQPSLIKRCSSMEELTYRSRNGATNGTASVITAAAQTTISNGKPATGSQLTNGHCNHHQQVNGTKKRLLWSSLNGHTVANSHTNGTAKEAAAATRSTFVKNGQNHQTNGHAKLASKESAPPVLTNGNSSAEKPNGSLYPSNIVRNIVKTHQTPKSTANGGSVTAATSTRNGPVRHYPSPITNNYVRSNLLLTAPLPYIRKSKSVEALSVPFSVSPTSAANGIASPDSNKSPAYLVPVELEQADDDKPMVSPGGSGSEPDEPKWTATTTRASTGNVHVNDESVCCYQADNGEEESMHPAAAVLHVAADTAVTNGDRTALRSNEHDWSADQRTIVSPGVASPQEQRLNNGEQNECQAQPKVVVTGSVEEAADGIVMLQQKKGCTAPGVEEHDGTVHLDSSLLNDSGICETVTSSLASTGTIGHNNNNSGGSDNLSANRQLISDSEMPKPDIVKTYKRLFELPARPAGSREVATATSPPTSMAPVVKSSPSNEQSSLAVDGPVASSAAAKCDDSQQQVKGPSAPAPPPVIPSRSTKPKSAAPAPPTSVLPAKPVIPPRRTIQSPVGSSGASKASPSSRSPADVPARSSELSKVRSHLAPASSSSTATGKAPMTSVAANHSTSSTVNGGAAAKFTSRPTASIAKAKVESGVNRVASANRSTVAAAASALPSSSLSSPTTSAKTTSSATAKSVQSSSATAATVASASSPTTHSAPANVTDKVFPSSSSAVNRSTTAAVPSSPQPPPPPSASDNASSASSAHSKVVDSPPSANTLLLDAAKKLKPVANIRPIQSASAGSSGVPTASSSTTPAPTSSSATSSSRTPEVAPTTTTVPAKTKAEPVNTKPIAKNEVKSVASSSPTPSESKPPSSVPAQPKAMSGSAAVATTTSHKTPASSPASELVTLKPSLLKSAQSNQSAANPAKSTLWGAKSSAPPSGASSVVFDFRDNKSVKANIALQPAPFGAKPIQKRVWQEINGGDGADYEYDEEDDANYSGTMEVPPPSGIHFEGENVVAGKSCLMARRNKNLSIQFNDSAISTTFEYPSDSFDSYTDEEDQPDRGQTNAKLASPGTSLQNKLLTGGNSTLASYKPSQIKESVDFQLGITKSAATGPAVSAPNSAEPESLSNDVNDHIVPASQEDTVSFSKSSTASDLLF